ncbi:site-specific integrase [Salmonella enterica]|nr:site-specific integrase [Salmonella enterica]EBO9736301.1 site-specific integrase [Salmonella enterica]EDY1345733.1 site-specific integrase [Salmonella enterica subsp. enterica serovar Oranienburg]EED8293696.1 site-specific integrase [Salmonella enterica subsp. enterica serovar Oranienburg]
MELTKKQKQIAEARLMIAHQQSIDSGTFIEIQIDKMIKGIIGKVKTNANDASKEQYRKHYRSAIERHPDASFHELLMQAGTASSFDKRRTAFRFCITEEIQNLRRKSEKAMRSKDYEAGKKLIQEAFKLAIKFEDEFLSDNRILFNDVKSQEGFKKVSFSKKKGLKKAPDPDVVLNGLELKKNLYDRHSLAFAVISAFGIRPAEMQKGVKLTFKDGMIYALVKGAKVSDDKGHKHRAIGVSVRDGNKCDQVIMEAIYKNGGEVLATQTKSDYDSLRKYFNNHYNGTSLYTYRHQVASDLKKAGVSKTQIAEVMGHRTTESQVHYGYARSSRGGRSMVAKGSNEVISSPDIKDYLKPKPAPAGGGGTGSRIAKAKNNLSQGVQASYPKLTPRGTK